LRNKPNPIFGQLCFENTYEADWTRDPGGKLTGSRKQTRCWPSGENRDDYGMQRL